MTPKRRHRFVPSRTLAYAFLIIFAAVQLGPVLLMFMNSFKSDMEVISKPVSWPSSFMVSNYVQIWERAHFSRYMLNSAIVTVCSVLLLLLVASMLAFYLARFDFRWNKALLMVFLLGLMIPLRLAVIPIFSLMRDLHLLDSLTGLTLVMVAQRVSFAVFVLYGFALLVPREIEEAALVDGAGLWSLYRRVFVPLMAPALGTVAIVTSEGIWNEFFFPLVLIRSEEKKTIPLGLANVMAEFRTEWALLFAGLSIAVIPVIIIFVLTARKFMEGMTEGAVR